MGNPITYFTWLLYLRNKFVMLKIFTIYSNIGAMVQFKLKVSSISMKLYNVALVQLYKLGISLNRISMLIKASVSTVTSVEDPGHIDVSDISLPSV